MSYSLKFQGEGEGKGEGEGEGQGEGCAGAAADHFSVLFGRIHGIGVYLLSDNALCKRSVAE